MQENDHHTIKLYFLIVHLREIKSKCLEKNKKQLWLVSGSFSHGSQAASRCWMDLMSTEKPSASIINYDNDSVVLYGKLQITIVTIHVIS